MADNESVSRLKPRKFGKYLLLEKIGSGGMAEIFKAVVQGAEEFQKVLVVKRILLPYSKDPNFVDMFVAEAKITAPLQHANLVSIHEFDEVDGQYYISMEYVHGRDLQKVMARANKMGQHIPQAIALFIAGEVCKALRYAYNSKDPYGRPMNIIHRDVSPSNVLISYDGDVKVTDFGVAKAATSGEAGSGMLKGKLGYMSPEQVLGRELDHRSDLFSLGIILFECLTLKRLFLGRTDLQTLINVRDADLERRLTRHPEIEEPIADILRKALEKDPAKRYANATDMLADIEDQLYETGKRVGSDMLSALMREIFSEEAESDILPLNVEELSEVRAAWGASSLEPKSGRTTGRKRKGKKKTDPKKKARKASGGKAKITDRMPLAEVKAGTDKETDGGEVIEGDEKAEKVEIPVDEASRPAVRTRTTRISPQKSMFQLKDSEGNIFGPVSFDNLLSLIKSRAVSEDEQCSVNDGPWIRVKEVAALQEHLENRDNEYSGMGLLFEGTIERQKLLHTVYDLCRNKRLTGALLFRKGSSQKEVFFRDGRPRLIFSNLRHELLGEFLVQRNLITREQVNKALMEGKDVGFRLGDSIVAQGMVPAHVLAQLQLEQFTQRFVEIFKWQRGWFGVFEKTEPPFNAVTYDIDPLPQLAEAARSIYTADEIRSYLAPYSRMKLVRLENSRTAVSELRLHPKEMRVVNLIESHPVPADLVGAVPGNGEELTLRVIFLLTQTEIYNFKTV
ncbi:MAG: serine/threonine protein kinase [Deltaproteobacteria bacterium]|nr:serine/threonine protein kinase [Deltaproteobacteria bacterium]